ncbi:MAG: S41 family peptidase [Alphaproteobacteria bacterium]|nr:S41 family peptidase [Alphaproteobacteria bacterium]MBV9370284.1 S41 family peptidase [Alphaproteobacteria bacterium]MBV9899769.1 S41 family peptidase [Alphaproteobacteria bacterium]
MLRFVLMGSAAAVAAATAGSAQPGPAAPRAAMAPAAPAATAAPFDAKAAVAEVRRVLAAHYVLPEMRPKLDAALAKALAEGRYDVDDPRLLAERINADLAAAGHDRHTNFRYAPEQAARTASRPPQADDAPPTADEIRRAQRRNHGLVALKLLPGNVRYMDTDGFVWAGPTTAAAYDNAMRFLAGGDAVIIDLRHNGGGSPDAVQYLVSHFVAPDTPLMTFYMGANPAEKVTALKTLPAGRLVGKPLYVLTSGRTASAAEEFAGHVGGYRIGELIGEKTAGAGFRNEFFAVPEGFLLSVSVGRAVLASTGKDWEGVGIAPTTAVPVDRALDVARLHAMQRLAATAAPEDKRDLEAMAAAISAQLDPVATALPLDAYAGRFGDRTLRVEGGRLTYQRADGPKLPLVATGPNAFAFEEEPTARLEFTAAGGATTGFDLVRGDGTRQAIARTG